MPRSGSYSPACSCPAIATRFQALIVTMIQVADGEALGAELRLRLGDDVVGQRVAGAAASARR